MQSRGWHNRVSRSLRFPAAAALGAVGAAAVMHGSIAGSQQTAPPVQPSQQALEIQNAFEQVADKLRPSVVFIKSSQKVATPNVRRSANDDDSPFGSFSFPGFPGMGGQGGPNMRQFRSFQMPMNPRGYRAEASGSGVIVRSDGYILTNSHVVEGADKVTVRLQDGREFVGKVSKSPADDLAVIKIEANNLPAAQLADSDNVKIGQWAIAFGSPFRLQDTMTVGVVSSLKREQQIGSGDDLKAYPSLIQTDASINPGNSGGPLVDVYGRVVGINVAIESPSGGNVGIGFAIPANTAKYVMDQLIRTGTVSRGFLGVGLASSEIAGQRGVTSGALVMETRDGTPAARAGFQVGDVVTKFDGKDVATDGDLRQYVARTKPGVSVPVVVRRDGRDVTLAVTVGSPEANKTALNNAGGTDDNAPDQSAPMQQGKLGVRVANASDANVRQQLNLKGATNGAVVVEVVPGSPASQAGLQPGDVITRLDGKPVADAAALSATAKGLKDGQQVTAVVRRGPSTILAQISLE